jgi:hypothetical protein
MNGACLFCFSMGIVVGVFVTFPRLTPNTKRLRHFYAPRA